MPLFLVVAKVYQKSSIGTRAWNNYGALQNALLKLSEASDRVMTRVAIDEEVKQKETAEPSASCWNWSSWTFTVCLFHGIENKNERMRKKSMFT